MWNDFLEKNIFISQLYDCVPSLSNVNIIKIEVKESGDRINIGFDMPCFPKNPPDKWIKSSYDAVYIELNFFDIREMSLISSEKKYVGDIELSKEDDLYVISIKGNVQLMAKTNIKGIIQCIKAYSKDLNN